MTQKLTTESVVEEVVEYLEEAMGVDVDRADWQQINNIFTQAINQLLEQEREEIESVCHACFSAGFTSGADEYRASRGGKQFNETKAYERMKTLTTITKDKE